MFKDKINVLVFDDPEIKGVACYVTYYDRALSLTDSAQAAISCRRVGPISGALKASDNVFAMEKSLFFKETRVTRFYDAQRRVLVYLAYTASPSAKASPAHSLSVVPVDF